jgi:hypothetical protein
MPNKNTFKIKPIKRLVEFYVHAINGTTIDPFSNSCELADIRNDIDPQYETEYNLDALEFMKTFQNNSIGLILLDPPFSPTQVKRVYKKLKKTVSRTQTQKDYWSKIAVEANRILRPGGFAISCGWNSGGLGKKYGFKIWEILLVPHGGSRNDTIVTVDFKE